MILSSKIIDILHTAIEHTRDERQYNSQEVLPPMKWFFSKVDSKISSFGNDIKFTKKILKIVENTNI